MKAKRSLGQNFLVDASYQARIVRTVNPQPEETIIEIGPGHGALTEPLLASGARVIAVELDAELIPVLQREFGARPKFRLQHADALTLDWCATIAPATTARVVANLPYYISTPILQRLIAARHCLSEMTVMLQREVVERIVATPGGKEYGVLSVLMQLYCEATQLFDVPPGAFRPAPKIWSSVVRLRVRATPAAIVNDETLLLEVVKTLFAQRRKTIANNLRAGQTRLNLPVTTSLNDLIGAAELNPQQRAETLTLTDFARLANAISRLNS